MASEFSEYEDGTAAASAAAHDVTTLLIEWCDGDEKALEQLMPLVYGELLSQARRALRRERPDHTLQPTALVHEAFLQLIDQNRVRWQNRAHFFGVSARLMRRVMLKYARQRQATKRGGGVRAETLDGDQIADIDIGERRAAELIALDEALTALEALDPRQGAVVELRYFGGLTVEEAAEYLKISTATVKRETRLARAWLQSQLRG
ncbi:MAG: sigma-70 family RNA polymerase sigma factor, partial [Acidobacteriota bacterium]